MGDIDQPFGAYTPESLLASGPWTQVWQAAGPNGPVALKVAVDEAGADLVLREASRLRAAPHPHIARYIDHDVDGRWMARELLDGERFGDWAPGKSLDEVVRVVQELLSALYFLHERGVAHGDVTPANVLIDTHGHPKLIDLAEATALGQRSTARFTPGFAAPELLAGGAPSASTDAYGVGGLLHFALTGAAPNGAHGAASMIHSATSSLPLPPSAWPVDVPAPLDRLVERLLARSPSARPTLDQVASTLEQLDDAPLAPMILGMHAIRRRLRQEVVRVADGEPRVVVIYGPAGSGRRTLARDTWRAARSEGLTYIREAEAVGFLERAAAGGAPPIAMWPTTSIRKVEAALSFLESDAPGLILLYGSRPVPKLHRQGALHLTPPPLGFDDAMLMGRRLGVDAERTQTLWRRTSGHPGHLWLRLQRAAGGNLGEKLCPTTLEVKKILDERGGDLDKLVRKLRLPHHEVLDHVGMLQAHG